jgi:hypothetical protein
MGSQEITHNPGYYISLGVGALAMVVLLALVIVGIVIAVRAKTGTGKGCGIEMAIAFVLQAGLVAFWLLITIVSGFQPSSSLRRQKRQRLPAILTRLRNHSGRNSSPRMLTTAEDDGNRRWPQIDFRSADYTEGEEFRSCRSSEVQEDAGRRFSGHDVD